MQSGTEYGVICHRLVDQQYHKPNDDILMTPLKYGLLGVLLLRTRIYVQCQLDFIISRRFYETYILNNTKFHTLPE